MKKRSIIILLCLICFHLSAQEWVVSYTGAHPSGLTTLADGFVDEDGVTFLAGREGENEEISDALLMRIEPTGTYSTFKYTKEGFHSRATCIIEMSNQHLFVAGNMSDEADDYIMVLILDKQLNLIEERQYGKEVDAVSFRDCKATLDSHGHVIVATAILQNNQYQGYDIHGVFFKFTAQGDLVSHRYLIEDYPDPLYFLMDFRLRQMWYREENETLLCLSTGYGGVLSFVTFDSDFNYIEEHPIWREEDDRFEHTINREDCFTDHWYNENEALVFSSRGDYEHNKLRVSRINTQGEFLDFICLNERGDTIDDAGNARCMATVNDSTFYFLFHYHTLVLYPGVGCVYQLNQHQEIVGRHLDDDHQCYQSRLILPTTDNGCIIVYDSCAYQFMTKIKHPVIKKLVPSDFEQVYLSTETNHDPIQTSNLYPNPAIDRIYIPIDCDMDNLRFRITDTRGLLVADRIVDCYDTLLGLDISRLKPGVYQCQLYTSEKILYTEKFIKKQ